MYETGKLAICRYCKSYQAGKCKDTFEPGVLYPCINYLRRENADRQPDNKR